ncbi:hypothetical protein HY486_04545 [Candidatus Woesearchaeota archaeon]|nr:hypothetical protein [Candidatus Woesearchaeota archaeon]
MINKKEFWLLLVIAVIPLLAVFKSGYLAYTDNPVRQAEIVWFSDVLRSGWISGWSDADYAGMPVQLYNYQLGFWIAGLLSYLFGVGLGYKVFLVLVQVFLALSVYSFLKSFFPKGAFLASVVFVVQAQLLNRILEGLWAELIGFSLLLWFFLLLVKSSKLWLQSVVFGLIVLSHLYSAIAAVVLAACLVVVWKKPRVLLPVVFGSALTFFYWFPFVETRAWFVPYSSGASLLFKLKQFGYLLLKSGGGFWRSFLISIPSIILLVSAFFERDFSRVKKAVLFFSCAMLVISLGPWEIFGFKLFSSIIPERFLLYVRLGLVFFAADVFSRVNVKPYLGLVFSVLIAFLLPGAWFAVAPQNLLDSFGFVNNAQGRVLLDDTSDNSKYNLMPLAHVVSNVSAVSGFTHNPKIAMANLVDFADDLWFGRKNISSDEFLWLAERFNVQYIVTDKVPPAGKKVFSSGGYNVFELPFNNDFVVGEGELLEKTRHRIVLNATGNLVLKMNYHPYWKSDKGRVFSGDYSFMALDGAEGITVLTYDRVNDFSLIVSVVFACIIFYTARSSSRKWNSAKSLL